MEKSFCPSGVDEELDDTVEYNLVAVNARNQSVPEVERYIAKSLAELGFEPSEGMGVQGLQQPSHSCRDEKQPQVHVGCTLQNTVRNMNGTTVHDKDRLVVR